MGTIEHPSYTVNGNQPKPSQMTIVLTGLLRLKMAPTSWTRVVLERLRRQSMLVLFWLCLFGMITMPTCCGWTRHTQWIPLILVQPAAHAPHLLAFQQMWNLSRLMLTSSSPTSRLDQLAPQSLARPQVQLQCPQPHRLPQHHLTVLVAL